MKKMGICVKRALSLALAIIMVVTLLPQGAATVYGAELSESEEELYVLDSEISDEAVPEVEADEIEVISEEIIPEEIASEEITSEESIQEETVSEVETEDIEAVLEEVASEESIQEEILSDEEILETEEFALEGEELQAEENEVMDENLDLQDSSAHITFDANGGIIPKVEGFILYDGENNKETFDYEGNDTDGYVVKIASINSIKPTRDGYFFVGWFDDKGNSLPEKFDTAEQRKYFAKWEKGVTFKVTDGKMPTLDPNAIEYVGNETDGYTSQTFRYFEKDGKIGVTVSDWEYIKPEKEGSYFYDWLSEDDELWFPYQNGFADKDTNRTYVAKLRKDLGEAPEIDEDYGSHDGVRLYNDQTVTPSEDGVCFAIKVDKNSYKNIEIGANQALRIYYTYGAKIPVHRNDGTDKPDREGYYSVWNTQLVNNLSEDTILPVESDFLFDSNPTKAVDLRFSLKFVLVEKDDEGNSYINANWSNVTGESEEATIYSKYTPFVTSTSLKNKAVLKPAIGGAAVTSAINVNTGASAKNLDIMYVNELGENIQKPDYVDVNLTDGKLTVKALAGWEIDSEGKFSPVRFVFYDKSNDLEWKRQLLAGEDFVYAVTPEATWINKAPSVSLTSATDIALNFKVSAPTGITFDDNYYVAVDLMPNGSKTKLSDELNLNTKIKFIKINNDGTIPEVSAYAFTDGDEVEITDLGKGLGTSMIAEIHIVRAKDDDPYNPDNILQATLPKKLTVSTKAPYYADKITLKKGVTNLYASDTDKIVATVDFGKNTTYTRAEDWEIENVSSLASAKIYAEQEGNNKIKVRVGEFAKAGTYTITAATKAGDGVPARASISVKVLPTAKSISISLNSINLYHKTGKADNYAINVEVQSQDYEVIKKPTLTYEIGKLEGSEIETVKGLSISKGKIKIDKSFKIEENAAYAIKVKAKCGCEISDLVYFKITEEPVKLAKFKFPGTDIQIDNNTDFTITDFLTLPWNQSYLNSHKDKEYLDADDLYVAEGQYDTYTYSGIMIEDADGNIVNSNLLKSVKIPNPANPACFKKTGKLTFTATAIDGTKLTRTINIIPDTGIDFDSGIYVSGQYIISEDRIAPNATLNASGESTGVTYSVWLAKADELSVNTKNGYISGETLTVKGGKIVENIHNDYIKFVMTGKTATITRKKGKTVIGKYTITNDSFNLKTVKVSAEKKKIYTNYGDNSQDILYTFDKEVGEVSFAKITSTNSLFNRYISSSDFYLAGNKAIRLTIAPEDANGLKVGSYPFTIELFDEDANALCKPSKATLKVEKLKKSFKFTTKYTMSNKDKTHFKLEASGVNYDHIPYEDQIKLFNANTKGKYNNITDILEVYWDGTDHTSIRLREGAVLPNAKSITGYIGYTVNFKDGSSEYRLEKITINISNQAYKYTVKSQQTPLDGVSNYLYLQITDNNKNNYGEVDIDNVAVLDAKTKELINGDEGNYCIGVESRKVNFQLDEGKVTKPGTYSIKLNIIPKGSAYEGEEVTAANSIPITVKIKVTK